MKPVCPSRPVCYVRSIMLLIPCSASPSSEHLIGKLWVAPIHSLGHPSAEHWSKPQMCFAPAVCFVALVQQFLSHERPKRRNSRLYTPSLKILMHHLQTWRKTSFCYSADSLLTKLNDCGEQTWPANCRNRPIGIACLLQFDSLISSGTST